MQLQTKLPARRNTVLSVNGHNYKIDGNGVVDVPDDADAKKLLSLGGEFTKDITKLVAPTHTASPGQSMRTAADFVAFLEDNADYAERVGAARSFNTIRALGQQGGFLFTEAEWKGALAARAQSHAQTADVPPPAPKPKRQAPEATKTLEGSRLIIDEKAQAQVVPAEIARANTTDNGRVQLPQTIDDQVDTGDEDAPGDPPLVQAEQPAAPAAAEALKKLPAYCFAGKIPEKIPEEAANGEWPDPVPEMSMPYLRRMGAAYSVKFPAGTTKESALELLKAAMYE